METGKIVKEFLNEKALLQVEKTYKVIHCKIKPRYIITTFFRYSKKIHQTNTMNAEEAMMTYANMVLELQNETY